ncbi:MAG: hypothetical protein NTX29_03130 [Actinobacteria bacterium]|nr:hypothetical protein [Actinomycetota bacterium]
MNRNKTAKAGASFKVLALMASLSMILMGFAAGLMASPASAAAPSVCPTGYVLNDVTGLCEGTATAVAEPGETPVSYTCPEGWTGPTGSNECTLPVEATFEYQCPAGYTSTDNPITEETECTKPGEWKWDDGKWECKAAGSGGSPSIVVPSQPTEPCVKKADSVKVWFCDTAVIDLPVDDDALRSKNEHEKKWHKEKEECGEHDGPKPSCPDLIVPAVPVYDYFCPAGYFPPSGELASESRTPVKPGTICEKPVTIAPTCPAGQNLVAGDCVTPPPVDPGCTTCVPDAPIVVATVPVVEAVVVAAPATVAAPAAATVAAPAPATVAVPAAATLPAAVPAGDGSQAPGMPMWALAMIAVGVLGAGFAGKSILAARK